MIQVDILTPAFTLPNTLSWEEIVNSCQQSIGLPTENLEIITIDKHCVGCRIKNTKFSMQFIESVTQQNVILLEQFQRAVEAIKTFQEKMEEDQKLISSLKNQLDVQKHGGFQGHSRRQSSSSSTSRPLPSSRSQEFSSSPELRVTTYSTSPSMHSHYIPHTTPPTLTLSPDHNRPHSTPSVPRLGLNGVIKSPSDRGVSSSVRGERHSSTVESPHPISPRLHPDDIHHNHGSTSPRSANSPVSMFNSAHLLRRHTFQNLGHLVNGPGGDGIGLVGAMITGGFGVIPVGDPDFYCRVCAANAQNESDRSSGPPPPSSACITFHPLPNAEWVCVCGHTSIKHTSSKLSPRSPRDFNASLNTNSEDSVNTTNNTNSSMNNMSNMSNSNIGVTSTGI
eukprot:TRINITY_DN3762_c0_g1_i4.p1 TRINITY_DN3762_c0_g1~~TRINITY_DN3762_c0_g1_i4.p1  ORF type:complete len:394 (-),score=37.78 TRINITY_DN3762_c0_g1_i4:71-1252(-)